MSPKKGMISIGNTYSNHQFSGNMLVFGSVMGYFYGEVYDVLPHGGKETPGGFKFFEKNLGK